jgi:hypothetical protein
MTVAGLCGDPFLQNDDGILALAMGRWKDCLVNLKCAERGNDVREFAEANSVTV